jgi:hypothetical protein
MHLICTLLHTIDYFQREGRNFLTVFRASARATFSRTVVEVFAFQRRLVSSSFPV